MDCSLQCVAAAVLIASYFFILLFSLILRLGCHSCFSMKDMIQQSSHHGKTSTNGSTHSNPQLLVQAQSRLTEQLDKEY